MEQLKKIMAEIMDISSEKITDNTSRKSMVEWDSFNHMLLLSEIEKMFNISFTIEEVAKLSTYKDLCALVTTKVSTPKNGTS